MSADLTATINIPEDRVKQYGSIVALKGLKSLMFIHIIIKKFEWVLPHVLNLIRLQWLKHFSSNSCISVPQQISCWLFVFIVFTYLFRSLADGNCLYSAVSAIFLGNNSLIYTLRTLTPMKLLTNSEFYSRPPVLIDVLSNGKAVLSEQNFTSFYPVFELARGLRRYEIRNKNEDLVALVKNETKLTCSSFARFLGFN